MKDTLAYFKLELDMAMSKNKPTKCRGRAKGITAIWEEGRREKLWINGYLPSGHGRAEMLQILTDMATGRRPGNRSSKALLKPWKGVLVPWSPPGLNGDRQAHIQRRKNPH